jgi:hypothetical protein
LSVKDYSHLIPEREAAALIPSATYSTLRNWRNVGVGGHRLPYYRIGAHVFIDPNDLEAFCLRIEPDIDGAKQDPCRSRKRKKPA